MTDTSQLKQRLEWWGHPDRSSMRGNDVWSAVHLHIQLAFLLATDADIPPTAFCARMENTELVTTNGERSDFCQAGVVAPPDSPTDGNFTIFSSSTS